MWSLDGILEQKEDMVGKLMQSQPLCSLVNSGAHVNFFSFFFFFILTRGYFFY